LIVQNPGANLAPPTQENARKKLLLILCCLVLAASPALAADKGTKAEAQAMVKKAVELIKANGKDQAFAEISNPKGKFVDRDLYVVVYDLKGTCLAHGVNPKQIGKNLMELRDPDGKYFVKERVELAKTQASFWQDYKFLNPAIGQIEPKAMYLEKHEDISRVTGEAAASMELSARAVAELAGLARDLSQVVRDMRAT
jgi:cytochrome c